MKSVIRNIIIIGVVLILGVVGYKMYFAKQAPVTGLQTTSGAGAGTSGAPSVATTSAANPLDNSIGQDFLSTLLSIESIRLDDTLFKDKSFQVLQDFNRPIPTDPNPGRINPFAPIGTDAAAPTVQVTTSSASSVTAITATLNGALVASDPTATRWFEYGTNPNFGMMTAPKAQTTPGAFAESIDKLTANTTYYVRANASVSGATILGNTLTFKTAQASR